MLNGIRSYNSGDFSLNKRYLWIWNPSNVPPHMGLSVEGRYFSLKATGVDINVDLEGIIEIILRKGIPVLVIDLGLEFTLTECVETFGKYSHTIPNEVTCLNPIKAVLKQSEPMKLAELLVNLQSINVLGKKIGLNIDETSIQLTDYSLEDIHVHLAVLSK